MVMESRFPQQRPCQKVHATPSPGTELTDGGSHPLFSIIVTREAQGDDTTNARLQEVGSPIPSSF